MSGFASWPLQQAIYSTLTGASAVTSLLATTTSVFDYVPDGLDADADFPYIVIGDDSAVAWDAKDRVGQEHDIMVHTWSRAAGWKETKQLQGAIHDALNRVSLTVTGHDHIDLLHVQALRIRDPDGKTRHGVQRFRAWTAAAA